MFGFRFVAFLWGPEWEHACSFLLGSLIWVYFLFFFVADNSDQLLFPHLCFLAGGEQPGQQQAVILLCYVSVWFWSPFLLGPEWGHVSLLFDCAMLKMNEV